MNEQRHMASPRPFPGSPLGLPANSKGQLELSPKLNSPSHTVPPAPRKYTHSCSPSTHTCLFSLLFTLLLLWFLQSRSLGWSDFLQRPKHSTETHTWSSRRRSVVAWRDHPSLGALGVLPGCPPCWDPQGGTEKSKIRMEPSLQGISNVT